MMMMKYTDLPPLISSEMTSHGYNWTPIKKQQQQQPWHNVV